MKLKVYHGRYLPSSSTLRCTSALVATTSKKRAAEIAGVSVSEIRNYWHDIGNENQTKVGNAHPHTLMIEGPEFSGEYFTKEEFYKKFALPGTISVGDRVRLGGFQPMSSMGHLEGVEGIVTATIPHPLGRVVQVLTVDHGEVRTRVDYCKKVV